MKTSEIKVTPTPEEVAKIFDERWAQRNFTCELVVGDLKFPCEIREISPFSSSGPFHGRDWRFELKIWTTGAPTK